MARVLTVSSVSNYKNSRGSYVEIPSLRLQGKWFQRLGFKVGSKVEVSCKSYGELSLKLLKD